MRWLSRRFKPCGRELPFMTCWVTFKGLKAFNMKWPGVPAGGLRGSPVQRLSPHSTHTQEAEGENRSREN